MNQQINLYQPSGRRERRPLSAAAMALSLVAVVLGLGLISALMAWGTARQERALEARETERAQLLQRVAEAERTFPAPREDAGLAAEVLRLERELAAKRSFLEEFDPAQLGGGEGFASVLRGLAQRPVQGLWLRELHLWGDGRLALHGSATDPRLVPQFVQGLGEEPVFHGQEFRSLRLQRPEQTPERVDFILRTVGAE